MKSIRKSLAIISLRQRSHYQRFTLRSFNTTTTFRQNLAGANQTISQLSKPKKTFFKYFFRGFLFTVVVVGATASVYAYKDHGLSRSIYFWAHAFPIYLRYRYTQWKVESLPDEIQDREYNKLHDRYAEDVFNIVLELKGFYIKIGQIGATRADFLPKQYLDLLTTLQDQVPYRPIHEVKKLVEDDLGQPLDQVFVSFEETPIGSASIGQVHRAVLKDGTTVAVKVMYPDAEQGFRYDIGTIKNFCELAQPAHLPMLTEIEKQFMTEFDYAREAEHLEQVHQNLSKAQEDWKSKVVVPRPIKALCHKNVLVMEYLPGIKLVSGIKNQYRAIAESQGMTMEEFMAKQQMSDKVERRGPSATQIKIYRGFLMCCDYLKNSYRALYNYSVGLVTRNYYNYDWTVLPINIPEIIDLLLRVHAHEIFFDGYFNGDPHPGNVLLLEDGRIGLIDYGQVKQLPVQSRVKLAKLILALADKDKKKVFERYHGEMGFATKHNDPETIFIHALIFFDRDDQSITQGKNIQTFFEELGKKDPVTHMPEDYVMAGRVAMLLRGLGYAFGYKLSIAEGWAPIAKKFLKSQGVDSY